MAGFFKNMMKERKKTAQELILDARIKLDEATRKNLNVIDIEVRNIRYARKHNCNKAGEAKSFLKVKNAYYALSIIENTRHRLVDIQTSEELYSAMNDLTEAIQKVNRVNQKSMKPNTGKFVRAHGKMEKGIENEMDRMSNMYSKIDSIDDLVSNDVVEKIIKGEPAEEFLKYDEGINVSFEDFLNIDLDEIREFDGGDMDIPADSEDVLDMDFSDF